MQRVLRRLRRGLVGVLLGVSVLGCSEDDSGLGYCVVTPESADARNDLGEETAAGQLVRADSGCIENEVLICGYYNSREQFVSDDCAKGVGAPEDE